MKTASSAAVRAQEHRARVAFITAFLSFLVASALLPGPEITFSGIPDWLFYGPWCVMALASFITIARFVEGLLDGKRIGIFYLVGPALLLLALFFVFNRSEIAGTYLRLIGLR